jgi:hypothetical protein
MGMFSRNKDITKTQRALKVSMWVLAFAVLIPYLTFSFSFPFVINDCNYETSTCQLRENLALQITKVSLAVSWWGLGLLLPLALLCGALYVGIGVYRQVKRA